MMIKFFKIYKINYLYKNRTIEKKNNVLSIF